MNEQEFKQLPISKFLSYSDWLRRADHGDSIPERSDAMAMNKSERKQPLSRGNDMKTWDGKTYAQLTTGERVKLHNEDKGLFSVMRDAWLAAGSPSADFGRQDKNAQMSPAERAALLAYAQMSSAERAALFRMDRARFDKLRAEWERAGMPGPQNAA